MRRNSAGAEEEEGPLLWKLYYDSLLESPIPIGVYLIGYANDLAVVVTARKAETLEAMGVPCYGSYTTIAYSNHQYQSECI
ncbi:hypothetical protein QE152_g23499 [Popillia japonica]|uniref:Uncharacterized protein n=1 Tax=Popillia japonica TaxID=7064 RepID=A0AAW1KHD0_POPJA